MTWLNILIIKFIILNKIKTIIRILILLNIDEIEKNFFLNHIKTTQILFYEWMFLNILLVIIKGLYLFVNFLYSLHFHFLFLFMLYYLIFCWPHCILVESFISGNLNSSHLLYNTITFTNDLEVWQHTSI